MLRDFLTTGHKHQLENHNRTARPSAARQNNIQEPHGWQEEKLEANVLNSKACGLTRGHTEFRYGNRELLSPIRSPSASL